MVRPTSGEVIEVDFGRNQQPDRVGNRQTLKQQVATTVKDTDSDGNVIDVPNLSHSQGARYGYTEQGPSRGGFDDARRPGGPLDPAA